MALEIALACICTTFVWVASAAGLEMMAAVSIVRFAAPLHAADTAVSAPHCDATAFAAERLTSEAWGRGGLEAEVEARNQHREEQREKGERVH